MEYISTAEDLVWLLSAGRDWVVGEWWDQGITLSLSWLPQEVPWGSCDLTILHRAACPGPCATQMPTGPVHCSQTSG